MSSEFGSVWSEIWPESSDLVNPDSLLSTSAISDVANLEQSGLKASKFRSSCGVDTAVQEIGEDGSITEFPKNLGTTSGATRVDSDFQRFFFSLFGNDFADTYVKKHKLDFLELQYEFEMKKKRFTLESDLGASLELPHSLIKMYTAKYKQSIQFLIDDSDYVGKIVSNDEYLILNKNVMKDIFGPAVKSTVGYLTNLTRDPEVKQCDAIILVGGFVDSAVVSGAVRFYFPNSNMITVEEAELCVLRGGVLLGHSPDPDFSFQSKFSYGLGMAVPFNENTHPKKKRFIADEVQYCTDVFQPLIFSGKKYKIGELSRSVTLRLNRPNQKRLAVPIYVLRDKKVQFTTDEGCSPIGKLIVNLEDRKQGKAAVEIQMTLLGDSLVVMGTEEGSIDRTDAAFPLRPVPSTDARNVKFAAILKL
ncbi:HS12B-like protein [Mya arenaria]|uniref:HS12B-like protein n=1 Tax=Mya arenaria TaxID=6604 RepID=A0ABY7DQU4_MYAAR|nr:HS12B-like protein [Mya arenaria]